MAEGALPSLLVELASGLGVAPAGLAAALLASLLCGLIGTLVVLRRLVALGGGVAHAAFGGIGLALATGFNPRWGAFAVAAVSAGVLSRLDRERSDRQDAVIGVLWAIGMAVGMWLIAGARSSDVDIEGYLFGDISRVHLPDLAMLAALDAAVLLVFALFGRELTAVAFDPEHAQIQGIRVGALDFLLLLLVAVSVVALLALVGVVLAIALLAIPPLVGLRATRGLVAAVLVATATGLLMSISGLWAAAELGRPAGPTVVLVGGALLALSALLPRRSRRPGRRRSS